MTPAKAQRNLSEILDGTRQPRTQEKGLPYYHVLQMKPKIAEKAPTYKDSLGDKVMNWIVIGLCGGCCLAILALVIRFVIAEAQ